MKYKQQFIKILVFGTRGEHTNHYTINVVWLNNVIHSSNSDNLVLVLTTVLFLLVFLIYTYFILNKKHKQYECSVLKYKVYVYGA